MLALLTFTAIGATSSRRAHLALGALTVIHLVAVRFPWSAGVDRASYLDQMITWMSTDQLAYLTLLTVPMLLLGMVLARVAFGGRRGTHVVRNA